MAQLYIRIQLHGVVADQRLCTVGDEVWLGSAPDAVVAFPGPSIQVRRFGPRLQVQGRWLDPGSPMRLRRGDLEVFLEAVEPARSSARPSLPMPDLRVLVASAAVVLLGAWWEAVGSFIERHPQAVASVMGGEPTMLVFGQARDQAHLSARVDAAERAEEVEDTGTADTGVPSGVPASYPVQFLP